MKSVFGFERVAMTPGKVVKAFRTNFGFTHRELAEITGIEEPNISAIENDRREVGLKVAIRLGAAFGLNPELILFPRGYQRKANQREISKIQKRATMLVSAKKRSTAILDESMQNLAKGKAGEPINLSGFSGEDSTNRQKNPRRR